MKKIENRIYKLEEKLEKYRLELKTMPSLKRRATIDINYDCLLNEKRKLEQKLLIK